MGRHRLYVRPLETGYRGGPRWPDPYYCEWGVVVGDRVRRLRKGRDLTLAQMSSLVPRPYEGSYHAGYFSRLERGWASAPLYTYLALADVFDVPPGRLLGPDDAQRDFSEGEMTMVVLLRRLRMAPDEAIARIVATPGALRDQDDPSAEAGRGDAGGDAVPPGGEPPPERRVREVAE